MTSDSDREDLPERAERVLADLRKVEPWRPTFIEFAGTPKSGKSTCIEIVRHFFRRLDYKVLAPAEGVSRRTPYYLKGDLFAYNAWSASYALMHVLEGLHGSDQYDLAILDRGLFDALVWFELLATERKTSGQIIPEAVRDRVHDFLLLDYWRGAIDGVLLFTTDAKTAMARENSDKLISEPGQAMNLDVIDELNDAYREVRRKYAKRFMRFYDIDTSESAKTSPKATAADVTNIILNVFEQSNHAAVGKPS